MGMESFGGTKLAVKKEETVEIMPNIKGKIGSLTRELDLMRQIRLAQETLSKNPDHPHKENWQKHLDTYNELLEENNTALDLKINALPEQEKAEFKEEHDRILRTIMLYENEYTVDLSKRGENREQVDIYSKKLEKLESKLNK